ncbi:adenylate/guanylate cyclase domain-containing protein [bacterium]|nr:GAF domain-containing protein [Chloroflexi bacterium CFX6]RIL11212.1 MAG: adenylate/guanylate cyclase domain-containing protein [bacterium]
MTARAGIQDFLLRVHADLAAAEGLDAQLAAFIDVVTQLVDAERASLFLHDPRTDELYARVATGVGPDEIRILATQGVAGDVFTTGRPVRIDDVSTDPRFHPRIDAQVGYTTRSLLCVPLRTVDGTVIGVAEALNKHSGAFTAEDQSDLEAVTAQAALALRNTLRMEDALRSSQRAAHFVEVVSEISTELKLGPLLRKIMEAVTRLLDAERSTLFLHDEKAGELFTEIGQGLGAQTIRIPSNQGIAGTVFTSGQSVNIPYAYADLRFNPEIDKQTGFFTRSILCVPMVNKNGKVIGVTQVLNKRGGVFTPNDEARLRAFTAQIAIGIENAQLFDDVQRMQQYNDRILASMSSAVVTFGVEGEVVTFNPAARRILRVDAADVVGRLLTDVFAGDNHWVVEKLERAVAEAAPESAVDAALVAGGERVSVNLTAMPLIGATGEPLGSMLLFDDISGEKRLRTTLARYVDAAVADRLIEADADILGGQSGVATVLFSDVKGFTPIAERLGPARTVALLNDYLTRMVGCIEDEGGTLDKFMGDGIMAVFGVPYPHADDPDRAVRAAVAMLRALRAMNADRQAAHDAPLAMRIGIHTGDVFSGNIGSPRRMDFTVMGDGVNLGARLESAGRQYGTTLMISEATRRALRGTYRMREVDRVVVKGKTEAVSIFEILEHHDDTTFPGMIDALEAHRDGLALYRQGRWRDAVAAFEKALAIRPDDGLVRMYIDRCRELEAHPPAGAWDGVWHLTEK